MSAWFPTVRLFTVLALVAGAACAADLGPRDIVRRSALLDEENWRRARNYTFIERDEERKVDSGGQVKSVESKTWDLTMLEGSPYRRLIAKNDQALPPEEERREEQKLQRSIEERRKETEQQREKRLSEHEKRRARFRDLVREVADAFDWRLVGEENMDGRQAYVLEAAPRLGYKPRSREGRAIRHFKGRLWIDKSDYQWVRAEADAIDTVSFGWIIARLSKGARFEIRQTRVNDEVWLPQRVEFRGVARIGLVKKLNIDHQITYKNYRKFSSESNIVSVEEVQD